MAKRDVDFLFEVGSLRHMPRAWKQALGVPVQNILEHSFRLMLIALIIARGERVKNEEKIMKMALLHDLAESRTLDAASIHKAYVERNEEKAIADMLAGTVFEPDLKIIEEYEARKTIEAKIVKDADNLEVDVEIRELVKMGSKTAEKYIKHRKQFRDRLYTRTAKQIWDKLQKADPDEWQLEIITSWLKTNKFR